MEIIYIHVLQFKIRKLGPNYDPTIPKPTIQLWLNAYFPTSDPWSSPTSSSARSRSEAKRSAAPCWATAVVTRLRSSPQGLTVPFWESENWRKHEKTGIIK